eukprot:gene20661-27447_t
MHKLTLLTLVLCVAAIAAEAPVSELQIETTHMPESCDIKAEAGDKIWVHYVGSLVDGKVFDSSRKRDEPISFKLGGGQVIKGWEEGLMGACVGERRTLRIPPHLGYGDSGAGGATLIFETELTKVTKK